MTRTSPKREVIIFDVNTPVVMSLAYPDGKEIPSKFEGARRFMFSTTDNKTFFCSEQVRNILVGMKLRKGERIQICKRETRLKGEKSSRTEWQVYRFDGEGRIIGEPATVVSHQAQSNAWPSIPPTEDKTAASEATKQQSLDSEPVKATSAVLATPSRSENIQDSAPADTRQTASGSHRLTLLSRLNQDMSSALKIAISSARSAEEYAKQLGHVGDNGAPLKFCNQSIQKMAASVFIELSIRTRNFGA
jgi:hypothetical protein